MKHKYLVSPKLKDENWEAGLAFLVDVLEQLNKSNVIPWGKDLLIHELYIA
jgi:hypothetical protein